MSANDSPPSLGSNLASAASWLWVMANATTFWLRSQELYTPGFFALAALNPLTALGLVGVLFWALHRKNAILLGAVAVMGLAQVVVNSPLDAVTGCGNETADDEIVIVASNVYYKGATANDVADMLVEADADLIVLVEVVPLFHQELVSIEAVNQRWPYSAVRTETDPSGIMVLSAYPITAEQIRGSYSVETTIATPYGPLAFNAIHTTAPFARSNVRVWYRQFDALDDYVRTQTGPAVLAGDFNATEDHEPFRNLLASTTNADTVAACGWSATWPTDMVGPAFMELDHVLVSEGVEVLDTDSINLPGSDHQAIRSVIRLNGRD